METLYTWRARDPTCMRDLDRKGKWAYMTFWARDGVRNLKASEGNCRESTCLVINSLPCPTDRSKEVISDDLLLWVRALIQVLLGS